MPEKNDFLPIEKVSHTYPKRTSFSNKNILYNYQKKTIKKNLHLSEKLISYTYAKKTFLLSVSFQMYFEYDYFFMLAKLNMVCNNLIRVLVVLEFIWKKFY